MESGLGRNYLGYIVGGTGDLLVIAGGQLSHSLSYWLPAEISLVAIGTSEMSSILIIPWKSWK